MSEPRVKIEWTIEVTETYCREMDWDEFAAMFDGDPPTAEQYRSGEVGRSDIDAEQLAGDETDDNRDAGSVEERYVVDVEIIPEKAGA